MTARFTLDDVIRAGGCARGVRRWFTARGDDLPPGVSLRTFLDHGMSLDEARACRDGFIDRALRIKEAEHGRKSGGDPKMQVTRYHLSMHLGICHGPVDAIKTLWVGEKKAWEGNITQNGVLRVSKENLFGGVKKEGGVSGHADVMLGGPDQLPPSNLVERLKRPRADVPGFRGITSLLFRGRGNTDPDFDATGLFGMAWLFTMFLKYRGWYWGTQPYLKPVWVTVQRIPAKGLNEATAAIPRRAVGDDFSVFYESFSNGLSGYAAWEHPENTYTGDPRDFYEIVSWYNGDALRIGRAPLSSGTGHPSLYRTLPVAAPLQQVTLRFQLEELRENDNGLIVLRDANKNSVFGFGAARDRGVDSLQRPNVAFNDIPGNYGNPIGPGPVEIGVRYRLQVDYDAASQAFTATVTNDETDEEFGSVTVSLGGTTDIKSVHFEQDHSPSDLAGVSLWDDVRITFGVPVLDANPAHVVYECLTDTDWGMGADPAGVDDESFRAAAERLYAEEFGLFLQWQAQSSIEDFINEVLDHVRGAIYPDPRTGKIAMALLRDDLDVPSLKTITPDNARLTNFSRKGWGETTNEVVVTWTRPETEQEETVVAQDLANIVTQGGIVSSSKNYHGIRTRALAARVAERDLREESAPLSSCEAEVNREFWDVTPFDGVTVDWPEFGLDGLVMRVMKVDYGDSQNATVKLSLVEDVFSLATATYVEPAAGEWVDPATPPVAVTQARLMPPPAYVVSNNGIDPEDVVYPSTGAVPLAVNPTADGAARYDVLREVATPSGDTTFQDSGGTRDFAARGTLAATLPAAVTSTGVMLDDLSGVPPVVEDLLLLGDDALANDALELALVTAVDEESGALTLLRGALDTVPREWAAGALVQVTPLSMWRPLPVELTDTQSVTLKFLTRTAYGMLEEYEASEYVGIAASRPSKPTRGANVKISGIGLDDQVSRLPVNDTVVTWSHRNRLLEDSAMYAWDAASLTPEAGTTYTVALYGEADTLIQEAAGLAGETWTYPVVDELALGLAELPYRGIFDYSGTLPAPGARGNSRLRVTLRTARDGEEAWQSFERTLDRDGYGYTYGHYYGGH